MVGSVRKKILIHRFKEFWGKSGLGSIKLDSQSKGNGFESRTIPDGRVINQCWERFPVPGLFKQEEITILVSRRQLTKFSIKKNK